MKLFFIPPSLPSAVLSLLAMCTSGHGFQSALTGPGPAVACRHVLLFRASSRKDGLVELLVRLQWKTSVQMGLSVSFVSSSSSSFFLLFFF